nr:MAG TPA: hypothetical protein [Caudoviricetes sp.]
MTHDQDMLLYKCSKGGKEINLPSYQVNRIA